MLASPERVPVSRMCTRDNIVHNLDINICVRRVKSLDLRSGIFFDTFSKSCYANFKYREIRNWINLGWSSKFASRGEVEDSIGLFKNFDTLNA